MPYDLIVSMFNARPGPTKIGLKQGLGLPIRHVVLSCEKVQEIGKTPYVMDHDDCRGHDISRTDQEVTATFGPGLSAVRMTHHLEPETDALSCTPPSAYLQTFPNDTKEKQAMNESQSGAQGSLRDGEEGFSGSSTKSEVSMSPVDLIATKTGGINLGANLGITSVPNHEPARSSCPLSGTPESNGAASCGESVIAGDGHYTGELVNGRPEGKGKASWPKQGHTYVGEWRNGVMHGQGSATYLNGDRYDGEVAAPMYPCVH